jgi:hypothetical protein
MNLEKEMNKIRIACKMADWFSVEQHVDYDFDLSLGVLFAEGRIAFYNGDVLEFNESIIPGRYRYRYQYMKADGNLIFRYDNIPHHPEISTFPDNKHYSDKIVESRHVNLKEVVEEIIELIVSES